MAEVIFRPFRVLRCCWAGGRKIAKKYMLSAWMVFLPILGFGLYLGKGLSGPAFRLDAAPSIIGNIGVIFAIIWLVFALYIFMLIMVIGIISYIRK